MLLFMFLEVHTHTHTHTHNPTHMARKGDPNSSKGEMLIKATNDGPINLNMKCFEFASQVPNNFLFLFQLISQIFHADRSACARDQGRNSLGQRACTKII